MLTEAALIGWKNSKNSNFVIKKHLINSIIIIIIIWINAENSFCCLFL